MVADHRTNRRNSYVHDESGLRRTRPQGLQLPVATFVVPGERLVLQLPGVHDLTDISLWIMLTDLQPHQQSVAIVTRLGGSAREMARMIRPQEVVCGGVRSGQQLGRLSFMLAALQDRLATLDEESSLVAFPVAQLRPSMHSPRGARL